MSSPIFPSKVVLPKYYTINSVWKTLEHTPNWQKAVLLLSVSILVTGVVFMIIAALIPASPASVILGLVGIKCLEIGVSSVITGSISVLVYAIFNKKKKAAENFSQDLLSHTVSMNPEENVQRATK